MQGMHGGEIRKAAERFGLPEDQLIDFSANINALGLPEMARELIIRAIPEIGRYPDDDCVELKSAIAQYLGVSAENVYVGNGASEIIRDILDLPFIRSVLIPSPTFIEYERMPIKEKRWSGWYRKPIIL